MEEQYDMRLIDKEKLLASMSAKYEEKKNIVPDTLAEGFMQMDKLIHEQDAVDTEVSCRLLRNQMVIMCALRNLTINENIQGLLDDNIKPTAEMLQEMK